MGTSEEEIERQHKEALRLVKETECSVNESHGEIPLSFKQRPTHQVFEDKSNSKGDFFPCWSSRGQVDVSSLERLVKEGYNTVNTSLGAKKENYTKNDISSDTNFWDPANAAINNVSICRPSHDNWGINKIILTFSDDFLQHRYHFPWWHLRSEFREALQPVLEILGLAGDSKRVVRLLFASLPPGVTIPIHHDSGEWVKHTHRVHVPIIAKEPEKILFQVGYTTEKMERIPCEPGHLFEINNQGKHFVSNCSSDHRVHMILDYVDSDYAGFKNSEPVLLEPGEVVLQTRRSLDRLKDRDQRATPYFLILGAQKAGTTSLYEYITQHPLVAKARRRETHCLDWRWNDKLKTDAEHRDWCLKFYFAEQLRFHPSCCTGDSTPSYLLDSRRVLPRLQQVFDWSNMKYFVMVREPIQRAESHYAMVTSKEGTPAQLQTRGSEWRDKDFWEVVQEEMSAMKACGLIPHWDMETGVYDATKFDEFAGSTEEDVAWDRYLERNVLLNTGSYGLLTRGMYELQLRSWLKVCPLESFLVLTLEQMKDVHGTMPLVWKHLDLPFVTLQDDAPKNTREYDPSLKSKDTGDGILAHRRKYLQDFYAPYNARLQDLLKKHGWAPHTWSYSAN